MCGIVGLFLKDARLEPQLGALLGDMLVVMSDRGPDSAGVAIYDPAPSGEAKITVQSNDPDADFDGLQAALSKALGVDVALERKDSHAILRLPLDALERARAEIKAQHPGLRIMSYGESVEIYKEVGLPAEVAARFDLKSMRGRHGVGHTRMATESAVTTLGAHPFSTAADQCLAHNGSLSNHNALRRKLRKAGLNFETENDTEVGAAYLSHKMNEGANLGEALEAGLKELDGFYTFLVGSKNGFGVLRDPIACKPAVLAETDQYVAFGSEYRALAGLPGVEGAKIWEPEPAKVYFWEH